MGYEAKSTDLPPAGSTSVSSRPDSPRRRRTIRAAEEKLDQALNLGPTERRQAMLRIRCAAQPNREARRIIDHHRSRVIGDLGRNEEALDQSDIQELVAKLIWRDGVTDPQHKAILNRLARNIALDKLTPAQFRKKVVDLWAIPSRLPKELRRAEARLLRE